MDKIPNQPPSPRMLGKLSALLDGELAWKSAAPAGAAGRDVPLRRAFEELEALDAMLGQWPAPPLADVRGAVMARVRGELEKEQVRTPAIPGRRWAAVAWAASWVVGGMLTGAVFWTAVNHRIEERLAAESMAQDMALSMIMTEDWTPPISTDEDVQP